MQTNSENNLTISLDIGISSIGWAVIESSNLKVKGCGSLLFQADDCLASKRRLFRSSRRNIAATRNRISRIAALLQHIGAFNEYETELVCNSSPWIDASRVLLGVEKLDWPRLWNIIRWYAHNRGYDGNKAWKKGMPEEEAEEEAKRVKAASEIMKKHGTDSMAQTVCAMLGLNPQGKARSTTGKKYKTGDYAFDRSVVESEVRKILKAHEGKLIGLDEKLIATILDDARLIKCPAYQLPLRFKRGLLFGGFVPRFDNRLISVCPITGEKTPSKRRKEFYEFRWAMTLAGLRVFGESGECLPFSIDERKTLDSEIRKVGFFTKSTLKKFVQEKFGHAETNIDNFFLTPEMENSLIFDPAKKAINTACLKEAFDVLPTQIKKKINSRLNKLNSYPPKQWIQSSSDNSKLSVLVQAGYEKAISRKRGKNKVSFEKWLSQDLDVEKNMPSGRAPYSRKILLKASNEVMEGKDPREADGCLSAVSLISKEKLSIPVEKQTNNHLIRHRLTIAERLYREILSNYAQGDNSLVDTVVIETARDLREFSGKTNKEKEAILGGKLRQHRDAVKKLEDFRSESGKTFRISANLIRKTRIAMDMEFRCPFTGDTYDLSQIIDDRIDIEHIIPRSLRPSDSMDGLVLTFKEVNKWKSNRTAFQFILEEGGKAVQALPQKSIMPVSKYESFVKKLKETGSSNDDKKRKKNRKRFLTLEQFNPRESDFTSGDLTVTSQLNRLATFRIRGIHKDQEEQPKFVALPGSATALARKSWKVFGCLAQANPEVLNEDGSTKTKSEIRNITHLHHALDATVSGITAKILPNDAELWRLLNKRRLSTHEVSKLKNLSIVKITDNNQPYLEDLPKEIKENLSKRLLEKRVRYHIPSRIGKYSPDENEYGVEKIDEELQQVTLRRAKKIYTPKKFSQTSGLFPKNESKLKSKNAVRLFDENYGLWIGDPITVIPMLRSWETIAELKSINPNAQIIRKNDIIYVPSGGFSGMWTIKSIKDVQRDGILVDLSKADGVSTFKKGVRIKSLLKSNLEVLPRSLI
ncbi:hypothetical protein N9H22_04935 [Opitutales bacterium]|nr:hypothetical protein [Opitutales bacterium]